MALFCRKQQDGKPRRSHGCLWTIIVFIVIYMLTSVVMGYMFGQFMTPSATLEDNTVYVLRLEGTLVEQGQEDNPFAPLMEQMPAGYGNMQTVVGLDDLKRNILLAKENNKVRGILLRGGSMQMGQASAKALREVLLDFKESGKFLVAYSDSYSQTNYYVASVADKILLNPVGGVDWGGLSAQKMYFKRVLDKIGVEMQIIKVGTFKSAVEPYFRTSMSEADREQTMLYVQGVWDVMKAGVAESRGMEVSALEAMADRFMGLQPVEELVKCGLVDSLVYSDQVDSVLCTLVGDKDYSTISTSEMSLVKRTEHKADSKVAVLYAEGEITDEQGDGIVGKKMLKQIAKIKKDKDIKAVVLRVNSPGGSADASEQIWHALQTLRESGKPVVVSMGDLAASGGYYISCGADYIYAEPNTITGSIGIFGVVPSFAKLRDKVGIDIDGVTTNRHSDFNTNITYKGMNTEERAMMQAMVERGYDLFTRRCAEGRKQSQDDIKRIAEGRVWLGTDALRLGLVDELGGLEKAVVKAADLAELPDYKVVYYPEKKDFMTQLLESLDNSTDEEKLVSKVRAFCSKPRVMALMDAPVIE
jgi:protease-4